MFGNFRAILLSVRFHDNDFFLLFSGNTRFSFRHIFPYDMLYDLLGEKNPTQETFDPLHVDGNPERFKTVILRVIGDAISHELGSEDEMRNLTSLLRLHIRH